MIRNQKMSISHAVLWRFECAKHQNGPFQPRFYIVTNQVERDLLQIGLYNA